MQFTTGLTTLFAITAAALPAADVSTSEITIHAVQPDGSLISLPTGCSISTALGCITKIGSTVAGCGAAITMGGLDPFADAGCIFAAGGLAVSIPECKNCIPN